MLNLITRSKVQLFLLLFPLFGLSCQKGGGSDKVYRYNGVMNVDGRARTYLLNLPPDYYDTSNLTLVIALHGYGGSAAQAEEDYGITDKANSEEFIVVYPEGTPSVGPFHLRSWNTGTCCPIAQDENVNDVHFISVLIDQMIANYKVNPKKVYVAGMSNGAMMAYTLACDLSDKIAAITSVSGALMVSSPCQPSRAVPILHIHSALDTKVPFDGGIGMGGHYFTPMDSTLSVWTALDSCDTPPQVSQNTGYSLTEWKDHNGKVAIDCYLTQDGGHSWPGGLKPRDKADPPSIYLNATDLLWDFFQQYELP